MKCYKCGKDEVKGTRKELRPYGPGGQNTCFECATADPETEKACGDEFQKRLNEALKSSKLILLDDDGPVPIVILPREKKRQ